MTADTDLARAARAKAILDDPLVAETFAAIEAILTRAWRHSEAAEGEKRERAYYALMGLDLFRNQFYSFIQQGAVTRDRLEQDERERQAERPTSLDE
jgi:hypothetical protein